MSLTDSVRVTLDRHQPDSLSRADLSNMLGQPFHRIARALKELRDAGEIKVIAPTGRNAVIRYSLKPKKPGFSHNFRRSVGHYIGLDRDKRNQNQEVT